MNSPQPPSSRQRLQALLAIPEGKRTDAQWDEINELEIELASSKGQMNPEQAARRGPGNGPMTSGSRGPHRPPGGGHHGKPSRKFHKRRPNGGAP